MRIALFGGTFNPIHWGHLLLAESAREALKLDRVVFIPTNQPPHKRSRDLVPGELRLRLIESAIRGNPAFVASDIELARGGTSYSIDTVRALHRQLPMAKLFLLIGEDMLSVRWFSWKEIKHLCTIVVAQRPAFGKPARAGGRLEAGLKRLTMPQVDISSSDIRLRLKAGRSIRYLVPPSVEAEIRQLRLYQKKPSG